MRDQEFRWEFFSKLVPVVEPFVGQRPVNSERVDDIKTALYNNFRQTGSLRIRHPIFLGYLADPGRIQPGFPGGRYILLDGQHRFECLRQLILPGIIPDQMVLISIITCGDEGQLRTEFNNLNNVTPMLACYTRPCDIVELAVKRFTANYPNIKEGAGKRKRPNIAAEVIKSALINSRLVDQYKITNHEKLCEALEQLQRWYDTWSWENFTTVLVCKTDDALLKFWSRIKADKLAYLGMFTAPQHHIWISHLSHLLANLYKPT